jgi:hypothetical protein
MVGRVGVVGVRGWLWGVCRVHQKIFFKNFYTVSPRQDSKKFFDKNFGGSPRHTPPCHNKWRCLNAVP